MIVDGTPKPSAWLKAAVKRALHKWAPVVGNDHWDIEITYGELESTMTANAQPQYERLLIGVNPTKVNENLPTEQEVERLVTHELIHGFTWDAGVAFARCGWQRDCAVNDTPDPEELLTTRWERSLWRAYQLGIAHGKRRS